MSEVSIAKALRDDRVAQQYLRLALGVGTLPHSLLPPRKWMQALYLTDAGRLHVSAHHLGNLLDISPTIAEAVVTHLAQMNGPER